MRALVLGANGQDGSYLCDALLRNGHQIVGVGRDSVSRYARPESRFRYRQLDLQDADALSKLVAHERPEACYHFAAIHGATGADFEYEEQWRSMMQVNVLSLHVLLEFARTSKPDLRIFYAGSCKIFPTPWSGVIDESTPTRVNCLYSIGKLAARDLMAQYRQKHGVQATNLILFNHDSPRRPPQYLLAKIARAIAEAKRQPQTSVRLRTLEFLIDWSSAEELMGIVAELHSAPFEPELVMASGRTVYARDTIHLAFARNGLDANRYVIEDLPRGAPAHQFEVNLARLESVCRRPTRDILDVIDEMVAAYSGH